MGPKISIRVLSWINKARKGPSNVFFTIVYVFACFLVHGFRHVLRHILLHMCKDFGLEPRTEKNARILVKMLAGVAYSIYTVNN